MTATTSLKSVKADRLLEGMGSPLNPALLSIFKKQGFVQVAQPFFF